MRISDWSSDVCSSDLLAGLGAQPQAGAADGVLRDHRGAGIGGHRFEVTEEIGAEPVAGQIDARRDGRFRQQFAGFLDRKSVVSGKSVSVRVDLGGRRLINKKTTKEHLNQNTYT